MINNIKYFFQFVLIVIFFCCFKIFGLNISSYIGGIFGNLLGPFFRSKIIIETNIERALPNLNETKKKEIIFQMWNNYGRILSEYMFLKKFRNNEMKHALEISGKEILEQIKKEKKPVIFVSGHFNNFELMAMQIEKSGIDLAAIYRPLNNFFVNIIMEKIRKKYICRNQVKKGKAGIRVALSLFKKGNSIALMIDQRVSEGILSNFFGKKALTTTIPAQFVRKFNCKVVPVYIERINGAKFKMRVDSPIEFSNTMSIDHITQNLNKVLENMILQNPSQWIWTHNRWK